MHINRLIWGSRRGMLELDLVLEPFVSNIYKTLEKADQVRFQTLLEEEDQDLFTWFMHKDDPSDPDLLRIVKIIRENTGMQQPSES